MVKIPEQVIKIGNFKRDSWQKVGPWWGASGLSHLLHSLPRCSGHHQLTYLRPPTPCEPST